MPQEEGPDPQLRGPGPSSHERTKKLYYRLEPPPSPPRKAVQCLVRLGKGEVLRLGDRCRSRRISRGGGGGGANLRLGHVADRTGYVLGYGVELGIVTLVYGDGLG